MKVTKEKKKNVSRSKLFGIVVNPKFDKMVDWKSMSSLEMENKLKELRFPDRFVMTDILNQIRLQNVNKNYTDIENFMGQLETRTETSIPHYQLAIKANSSCTKKKVLEAFKEKIEGHINVRIQFNFDSMRKYCEKPIDFISPEYSGKLYNHEWDMSYLDRKPQLRKIKDTPFAWQAFLEKNTLNVSAEDRTVDWIIDPIGNTGKSSFARYYVSKELTDGIFMKIDNLDRMELTLIKKIENYRLKYHKDPKVLLFDFPRASDMEKVLSATALMEDAKSGYLETTFGGNHKEIQIGEIHVIVFSNSCPDLSVLSVDRWRLWTLSGKDFGNIIWPVSVITPWVKRVNTKNWNIIWTIHLKYLSFEEIRNNEKFRSLSLPDSWLSELDIKELYTNDLTTNINYSPNFIRIKLMNLLNNELSSLSVIDFKEYYKYSLNFVNKPRKKLFKWFP
nr:hypothetical protein [Cylindrotheca closterium]